MADEDLVYAALAMDRSKALGNSIDVFNRRALHTKIGNLTTEPIPVDIIPLTTPNIINQASPATPNTEFNIALGSNIKRFNIKNRGQGSLRLAFAATETTTKFYSIPQGCEFSSEGVLLSGFIIYLSCSKANDVIEVLEWS